MAEPTLAEALARVEAKADRLWRIIHQQPVVYTESVAADEMFEAVRKALAVAREQEETVDAINDAIRSREDVFGAWSPKMTRHIVVAVLCDYADAVRELPEGEYDNSESQLTASVRRLMGHP